MDFDRPCWDDNRTEMDQAYSRVENSIRGIQKEGGAFVPDGPMTLNLSDTSSAIGEKMKEHK